MAWLRLQPIAFKEPHIETLVRRPMAQSSNSQPAIESILHEQRLFEPPSEFAAAATISGADQYQALYDKAAADPAAFWAELAEQELNWFQKWDTVLDWQPPFAKWFVGGKINISYNCLDRHLETHRRDKPAIVWEGEPGDSRTLTYAELHVEVCQMANVLKDMGVVKGDRVGIYMPMIPEAAVGNAGLCPHWCCSHRCLRWL